jgi:hypothetical protein
MAEAPTIQAVRQQATTRVEPAIASSKSKTAHSLNQADNLKAASGNEENGKAQADFNMVTGDSEERP